MGSTEHTVDLVDADVAVLGGLLGGESQLEVNGNSFNLIVFHGFDSFHQSKNVDGLNRFFRGLSKKHTEADLNWMDKKARSTIEMNDPASRPEIAIKRDNMKDYDTIFVGFPIWWYVAPTIINTFLESYDLTGKTIILFATSGGSDIGKTNERLAPSCKGAKLMDGKVFKGNIGHQELAAWVEGLKL